MTYRVVRHPSAAAFLERAAAWLLEAEDIHNLMLGIAYAAAAQESESGARGVRAEAGGDAYWATVERDGQVRGCCTRTPPHQALLTEMPEEALGPVVDSLSEAYGWVSAVLGPPRLARGFAELWAGTHGGGVEPGTDQVLYRLDEVVPPPAVAGRLRPATPDDAATAVAWGTEFARETHMLVVPGERAVAAWIERGSLWMWEDAGPACMAVAHGRTPRGIRIAFVYTPPERRRRGYAAACVAELSRRMLAAGLAFCVLYADRTNPTTNRLYQRIGYHHLTVVQDYLIHPEAQT